MEAQFSWMNSSLDDGWRKGPWTPQEDRLLIEHVNLQGEGRWNSVSLLTGLRRSGKSCRLRWVNYLRPDLKRGKITPHEENIILELHARWGNRWSTIARSLPGRTDNEIKNYWRTHFKKDKSTKNAEKARARFLKQQQQQQQLLEVDTTQGMMPQVEADAMAQEMQDMSCMFPGLSYMFQGGGSGSGSGSTESDDGSWGTISLWNLDDVQADVGFGASDQDQVFSFY